MEAPISGYAVVVTRRNDGTNSFESLLRGTLRLPLWTIDYSVGEYMGNDWRPSANSKGDSCTTVRISDTDQPTRTLFHGKSALRHTDVSPCFHSNFALLLAWLGLTLERIRNLNISTIS